MATASQDPRARYVEASVRTAGDLKTIAQSLAVRDLSRLSLPEIDAVADRVAQAVPAGNVPGMILNGLVNLAGRRPPPQVVKRDIGLLFRGVEQVLDRVVYGSFFAGPAAIIWGYQNLLKLAGKTPEDSFPEGVWQFYVAYALREDTARHTNETHGFDTSLAQHQIHLRPVDRITAWTMAAIHCLHQYDELLANEWRERVYIHTLTEATRGHPSAARYARLYRDWSKERPYGRGADADAREPYPAYRRNRFDRFLEDATHDLAPNLCAEWLGQIKLAEEQDLSAYQRQMSILAFLDPGPYGETIVPIPIERVHVGLIQRGQYHLIPACAPGTSSPADVASVRAQVADVVSHPAKGSDTSLAPLSQLTRASLAKLRSRMDAGLRQELDKLRLVPILLNADRRPAHLPLALARRAERGIGDHALTIFDTGQSALFDQSHIFFDGAWGAALAEIMTNEALSWAAYIHSLPPPRPSETRSRALSLALGATERAFIEQAPRVMAEASAETEAVDLQPMLRLRKLFKQRNDLIQLTVNDLLILYRAIHAITYQPAPELYADLQEAANERSLSQAALTALTALERSREVNPAILIPVDASQRSPRDRLYPMTFEVPLVDLKLLDLHGRVVSALDVYRGTTGNRAALYETFDRLQRTYLSRLAGFGAVSSRAKQIALGGESVSVGAIKLLAHMPAPLQHMLDRIPSRFEVLNDVIKGREVFSNVGAVAADSTLVRFITAKDDNEQKTLAWGVITDARGVMRITLRDFRPHVGMLRACRRMDLAMRIARDYVDAYASGLNGFVRDLLRITRASRETRLSRPEVGND